MNNHSFPKRPWWSATWRLLLATCFISFSSIAWSQTPEEAIEQANNLFNAGNYDQAAPLYEQIIKDYPTSAVRPQAEMQAGYAYYLAGDYDKALTFLKAAQSDTSPAAIKEMAMLIAPQATAAKADATTNPAERKKLFEEAIALFTKYLEQFQSKPEAESAFYGRALSYFQVGELGKAEEDLRTGLRAFAQSETILDSQYLLAITLAAQASELVQKAGSKATPESNAKFDSAIAELRKIMEAGKDIALSNDARFQLGEVLFQKASSLPEAEAAPVFQEAVDNYRLVKPRADMIAAQEKLIASIVERRRQALASGRADLLPVLQRVSDRAQSKLAAMQSRPDQTLAAALRVGQVYFQQGRYNEARVLLNHLLKFAQTEEQKRDALYFVTMTYIMQNQAEKAVASYDTFQASYKGAEIASNLPLAMGTMFLAMGENERSTTYFEEQKQLYPQSGELMDMAVIQKAAAESSQGKFQDALATFQQYLKDKPDGPVAVRAQAQFGIASAHRDLQQWDEAIAAFNKVISDYASEQSLVSAARMWTGYCLAQKGAFGEAAPILEAYVRENPKSELASTALFTLAQAQMGLGNEASALASFQRVADEYPDDPPATFAYFQIANAHLVAQRSAELEQTLKTFMEKYPNDPKVFTAVDTLAQNMLGAGRATEAIALYEKFAADHPDNDFAPTALLNASTLLRQQANLLGRYTALSEEQRAEWVAGVEKSIKAAETLARKYPECQQLAQGLQSLLEAQRMLVAARLREPEQVTMYMENLAGELAASPSARAKALFALAAYKYETDPAAAFETMEQAYDPAIKFTAADLDLYGQALIEKGKLEEAKAVYQKVIQDFPNPEGVEPGAAPQEVQAAQAVALYGLGRIAQEQGQSEEATRYFDSLVKLYPWSPKLLEANLALARADFEAGRHDDAIAKIIPIIRAQTATAELRADAMLLGGDIQKALYEQETDPKKKQEFLEAAIDYYIKIARFYAGVSKAASEGLWRGGQLLEIQAAGLTDPAKKARQTAQAHKAYKDLAENYPTSPYATEAATKAASLAPSSK